jgi:hypothetical protein
MKNVFKNEMMSASYVSPSLIELNVVVEGILCESTGTESLVEIDGAWS